MKQDFPSIENLDPHIQNILAMDRMVLNSFQDFGPETLSLDFFDSETL